MSSASPLILLMIALVAGAGCASKSASGADRDWSPLIGSYTYAQAMAELGKPDVEGEQGDGSRFAEWVTKRGSQMSFGFGVGGGSYGPHVATGVGVGTSISPPPSGEYLRLTFGQDGKLNGWTKIRH